jgi:hypothetical protein
MTIATPDSAARHEDFRWVPQPAGWTLVNELLADFLRRCAPASALAKRMREDTATRFIDWVDTMVVPGSPELSARLRSSGFSVHRRRGADTCFVHDRALLPDVIMVPENVTRIAIAVESVADFCAVHGLPASGIEGPPCAPFRRVKAWNGDAAELWAAERHGYSGFQVADIDPAYAVACLRTLEVFRTRTREFPSDDEGFDHAEDLITKAIIDVGRDMACDLFFAAEREYWQRRCRAGRVQKERQDRLGLGWANHDRHVYRSSRQCFKRVVSCFESLGMNGRERSMSSADAGCGVQVLEHPITGVVVVAETDMTSDEAKRDVAHDGLDPEKRLGTVGLWCALHGESFLQAGMPRLEAAFAHDLLRDQLAPLGVAMMKPSVDVSYLRQSLSEGERWAVKRERAMKLLTAEQIDARQARVFIDEGTMGAHLVDVERNDGFKGCGA